MSTQSFNPTIWAAALMKGFYNEHVFRTCVNRDYEGEIKGQGSTVRINSMGPITIRDFTRNSDIDAPDTLNMSDLALVIDQAKYFHYGVDDVDKRQARGDFMGMASKEASEAVAEVVDDFIASTINTGVDGTTNDVTNGTPLTVGQGASEKDAYGILVALKVKLDEANVPMAGRWAVMPPFFEGMLRLDSRFVAFGTPANRDVAKGDAIGRLANFNVLISNNCPAGASSSKVVLAGIPGAVTFADQLEEMSAYKPERRFGDAIKGLHVYGAKVTRPNCLAAAEVLAGQYY